MIGRRGLGSVVVIGVNTDDLDYKASFFSSSAESIIFLFLQNASRLCGCRNNSSKPVPFGTILNLFNSGCEQK